MTVKTKNDRKTLTFRKTQKQPTNDISYNNTNNLLFSGQLSPLNSSHHHQQLTCAQLQPFTVTEADPAAVSDVRTCMDCLPGDTYQSTALDCMAGFDGCSCERRAGGGCHGSQCLSYSDHMLLGSSHSEVAIYAPACNTSAWDGQGPVVQLSSSHTSYHHHQNHGTQ